MCCVDCFFSHSFILLLSFVTSYMSVLISMLKKTMLWCERNDVRLVCWSFVRCHFAAVAVVIVFFHFFPCAEFPHVVRPFHGHILFLHSHRGVVQFVLRNRVQCQYLRMNLQIWHIVVVMKFFLFVLFCSWTCFNVWVCVWNRVSVCLGRFGWVMMTFFSVLVEKVTEKMV